MEYRVSVDKWIDRNLSRQPNVAVNIGFKLDGKVAVPRNLSNHYITIRLVASLLKDNIKLG